MSSCIAGVVLTRRAHALVHTAQRAAGDQTTSGNPRKKVHSHPASGDRKPGRISSHSRYGEYVLTPDDATLQNCDGVIDPTE
jgi:hypothetical protein